MVRKRRHGAGLNDNRQQCEIQGSEQISQKIGDGWLTGDGAALGRGTVSSCTWILGIMRMDMVPQKWSEVIMLRASYRVMGNYGDGGRVSCMYRGGTAES